MFVLFLARSVNLASANPVCTECGNNTADSASKKVSSLSSVFIVSGIKEACVEKLFRGSGFCFSKKLILFLVFRHHLSEW